MYESTVAEYANETQSTGWRLPGVSPWFWMAILIGPTSYLYSAGDLVAAIVWGALTMVGWIGSSIGLLRPMAWMISGALASTAARAFSADLTPKVQEFTGVDEQWAPLISLAVLFLFSLLILQWFVWRPIGQYVRGHHTLSKLNAMGGFSLAVGKTALVLVLGLSGVLYLDDHPDIMQRLGSTPISGSVDLPGMVTKTAVATRASRVGGVVNGLIDWDELAESIDLEKIQQQATGGEGPLAKIPGLGSMGTMAMPSIGTGGEGMNLESLGTALPGSPQRGKANNYGDIERHLQSIQRLKF